jgi:hypothetical protein
LTLQTVQPDLRKPNGSVEFFSQYPAAARRAQRVRKSLTCFVKSVPRRSTSCRIDPAGDHAGQRDKSSENGRSIRNHKSCRIGETTEAIDDLTRTGFGT